MSSALRQLFMSRSIFEYSRQSLSVERENPVQMVSNCLQQSHLDKIASKPSSGEFRREMKNSSETCKAFPLILILQSSSHSSGNHECLGGWGREYAKIINRQVMKPLSSVFGDRKSIPILKITFFTKSSYNICPMQV